MYSRISNKSYRDAPFTDVQFACCPNYVYSSIEDLAQLVPERIQGDLAWCRTVGILDSLHGQFYVCNINPKGGIASDKIEVSFVYFKSPQSTVTPCPVQIFGSIQWQNRQPVIYVKLIQVLSVQKALQMKDIMDRLTDLKSHYYLKVTG